MTTSQNSTPREKDSKASNKVSGREAAGVVKQRTLKTSINCSGVALHSGAKVSMTLFPADADVKAVAEAMFDPFEFVETDEYGLITKSHDIEQQSFEIIIGTSPNDLGSSLFVGNIKTTGVVESVKRSWTYTGMPLDRGITYYGQIKVQDTQSNFSNWKQFSFHFNSVPEAQSVTISPPCRLTKYSTCKLTILPSLSALNRKSPR